jgi:glycosyltransferase involved in cell wall biosynthesis
VLGECRRDPQRAGLARGRGEPPRRVQLPQRFDAAPRHRRVAEPGVRVVEQSRRAAERLGSLEERVRLGKRAAAKPRVLAEDGEVEGHGPTLSGIIARVVGISLLTLAPGRMGGSEVYARELVRALCRHGRLEYVVAVPPDEAGAAGGLPVVMAGAPSSDGRASAIPRALLARRALAGVDAAHYPLTIPAPSVRRPSAITLHDVLHLDLPTLVPGSRRLFRRWAYDRAARRAARVIVPSAFVRERAVARLGLDERRVRVVPHGVDHAVFRPDGGPREPFVLYPARPWPHKNHARLFEAFALVRRERPELELVLTGGGHEVLPDAPGVRSLGSVPVGELAALYRRASALVFPSRYEGFGSPVLEAMASGCPVAASAIPAIEEVAAGAAELFSPGSAEEIAAGILAALSDAPALAARGLERAQALTWERTAALHDDVYAELVG